jgi:benzil reductase ((S)-benzoin forming)
MPLPTHLTIITGASRGMGLAMAQQLAVPGNTLLCISRQTNAALEAQAKAQGAVLTQWAADLGDAASTAQRLAEWLAGKSANFASATLVYRFIKILTLNDIEIKAFPLKSNRLRVHFIDTF